LPDKRAKLTVFERSSALRLSQPRSTVDSTIQRFNGLTMSLTFIIIAVVTLFAAAAAMSLRNLVHCALSLVVALAGLAAFYLNLGAQFVGFAQILVYVGAVAILIVFAVLLTRSDATPNQTILTPGWISGIVVSAAVFAMLGWAILNSMGLPREMPPAPEATVKNIGDALMTRYVLPLEVIGLLLTAALIGAVIIAMKEENPKPGSSRGNEALTEKSEIGNRKAEIEQSLLTSAATVQGKGGVP
jgi:NADH:ubiquinone oxidoreductase subunit 6 (subunit J)